MSESPLCVWCGRTRVEHHADLMCPVNGVTSQYYTPPKPEWPSECADCGARVNTDAEAFIHACLHSGDPEWAEFGNAAKLNKLPFIFFPIVGKLMEAYKRAV